MFTRITSSRFLIYLDGEEKNIAKEHMKGRLNSGKMDAEDLPQYESISYHFDQTEIFDILQFFFSRLENTKSDSDAREFAKWIAEEYDSYCDDAQKPRVRDLARGWEKLFVEKKNLKAITRIIELRKKIGDMSSSYAFDEEPF